MLPPAPGLFSMMNCCPVFWAAYCEKVRAMASVSPPGGKFTTMVTGLLGQFCVAPAPEDMASPLTPSAVAPDIKRRRFV